MAAFEDAVEVVLKNKGGLSANPLDPGYITSFGISLNFYKTIKHDADESDIHELSRDDAIEIYRKCFWQPNKYSFIANNSIATKVFDLSVNIGSSDANECLQRALCACGTIVDVDGVIGPQTLYAANNTKPYALMAAIKADAAWHYRNLVTQSPKLKVFIKGWLARLYEL